MRQFASINAVFQSVCMEQSPVHLSCLCRTAAIAAGSEHSRVFAFIRGSDRLRLLGLQEIEMRPAADAPSSPRKKLLQESNVIFGKMGQIASKGKEIFRNSDQAPSPVSA
jgi:hypothetical protein